MLIFEPACEHVNWYFRPEDISSPSASTGKSRLAAGGQENLFPREVAALTDKSTSVGYVLEYGAEGFSQALTPVTPAVIEKMRAVQFMGQKDRLAAHLAEDGLRTFPEKSHYLLCETAFFRTLPEHARFYALPQPWREKSPRRGAGGLTHARAYAAAGRPERLVSIHLCEQPSLAAILKGAPVETSAGFTRLDGLPGLTTCGELDATIVLELLRQGYSPGQTHALLARTSGFQVFDRDAASLADMVARDGLPRQMLTRGLLKAAGAALAALGGADCIAITAENPEVWQPLLSGLRAGLAFLDRLPAPPTWQVLAAPRAQVLFDAFIP